MGPIDAAAIVFLRYIRPPHFEWRIKRTPVPGLRNILKASNLNEILVPHAYGFSIGKAQDLGSLP
jgi:hypothetical protein